MVRDKWFSRECEKTACEFEVVSDPGVLLGKPPHQGVVSFGFPCQKAENSGVEKN